MLASTHFGVKRSTKDDWFDSILDVDTSLFVDPFLVFKESTGFWSGSHDKLISHFDQAFQLIAKSGLKENALAYKKAVGMLIFTEPQELCLGYTAEGTQGAGSGRGFAQLIARAIADAVKRGVQHPEHFEELGLLNEGIGADRISDITCTILKPELIAYTQDIAQRHKLPTKQHKLYAAEFDAGRQRFFTRDVDMPTNPITKGPLLFVPERFLARLPALNAEDWWEHYENEQLRQDLNYEILGKVNKSRIVATARQNLQDVRDWAKKKEAQPAKPYDLTRDPRGVVQWESASNEFTADNPLSLKPPTNEAEFIELIEQIVDQVKLFIEDQGGWYLLWDGSKDKPEEAIQLVFYGIARNYCTANGVVIDREVDLGRGPVDFKFSNGYEQRAHLEIKKLHNGKFWNGLDLQLPSYLQSDQVKLGWFLAVRYRTGRNWDKRQAELPGRVARVSTREDKAFRLGFIDARPKPSASKL